MNIILSLGVLLKGCSLFYRYVITDVLAKQRTENCIEAIKSQAIGGAPMDHISEYLSLCQKGFDIKR